MSTQRSERHRFCRAVVVDDHEDSADMLTELLRTRGVEVMTTYSGLAGLDAVRRHLPQLVLLDLSLPDLDGYEVARRIRSHRFVEPMCVVAVTGWADTESRARALEAGFDEHVVKPVDISMLFDLVAQTCG